ncbi:SRPBCC domain-containing protein [Leucobacter sp. HY1908]
MEASGRVVVNEGRRYLQIARSLALPIDEAWQFLTESDLTERWFGPWEGDAQPGSGVRVRMRFESHEPALRVGIRACEAPNRLVLHVLDEGVDWEIAFALEADGDDDTVLLFTQLLTERVELGEIGPGWEYYLDLLVAATEDTEEPSFEHYVVGMSAAYRAM